MVRDKIAEITQALIRRDWVQYGNHISMEAWVTHCANDDEMMAKYLISAIIEYLEITHNRETNEH